MPGFEKNYYVRGEPRQVPPSGGISAVERECVALHDALYEACQRIVQLNGMTLHPADVTDLLAVLDDPDNAPQPWREHQALQAVVEPELHPYQVNAEPWPLPLAMLACPLCKQGLELEGSDTYRCDPCHRTWTLVDPLALWVDAIRAHLDR